MGLTKNSLRDTISKDISIDEYEPKSGQSEEVVVVGFYATDQEPAEDLSDFISKGTIGIIDVDVSPNPNEEGNYLIFVEFPRDEEFTVRLRDMVSDIANVTGALKWQVSPYLTEDWFDINDPTWEQYVIMNPEEYVTKDDFVPPEVKEGVIEFMKNSMMRSYILEGNKLKMMIEGRQINATVLDYGSLDKVQKRNKSLMCESVMNFNSDTQVQAIDRSFPSDHYIYDLKESVAIQYRNNILLLTGIEYG